MSKLQITSRTQPIHNTQLKITFRTEKFVTIYDQKHIMNATYIENR